MALSLYLDAQNKRLVQSSTNAGAFALPDFVQGDTIAVYIYPLTPSGVSTSPFTALDWTGYALTVSIQGGTGLPTGTAGDESVIAQQATWVWNGASSRMEGTLSTATTECATFLGASDAKGSVFEVEVVGTDGSRQTTQAKCNIKAEVKESGTAPVPTIDYLTAAECYAIFLRYINEPGRTVMFKSPNGSWGRVLGVDNDGNAVDDIVAL